MLYAPVLLLTSSLVGLWIAFGVAFMGGRLAVLVHRERSDAWMITGSPAAR